MQHVITHLLLHLVLFLVCPSGEHYNKNQFNCDACPGGKYQPNEGTSSCLTCPGGKITFQNGAKSVQDCVKSTEDHF